MTDLVTLAARATAFAGIGARCGVRDEVCVAGTLCALAGKCVYVMSGGARHAGRAGRLGAEGTSLTRRGHSIHSVTHRDGVDPCHVVHVPTYLEESAFKTVRYTINQLFLQGLYTNPYT